MRHVGSPLFAVIVCRKFATVAALSWHLPHHKNAAALITGNFEFVARPLLAHKEVISQRL
jgi:hypothetical protein